MIKAHLYGCLAKMLRHDRETNKETYLNPITFEGLEFSLSQDKKPFFYIFSYAIFKNCDFTNCTMIQCIFENCTFENCTFENTTFEECTLSDSDFNNCTFGNTLFKGCYLGGTNLPTETIHTKYHRLSIGRLEDNAVGFRAVTAIPIPVIVYPKEKNNVLLLN